MKGFLILLVFFAAGLAGVLAWRRSLQAPNAPVVADGAPAKVAKEPSKGPVGASEGPVGDGTIRVFAPSAEERAPVAPGGAATTEVPPDDVFGALSPPSAPPARGGRGQLVDEPEPVKLRAADLKIVWQGEDLSRPETVRLDLSNDSGGHELSETEIDARFRTKEDAVLDCVARARPNEYTFVPGRVTVRFRIQRTGALKGVQVEAPVILHKGGLTSCIRGVVSGLRFPASSASQVVTFPFTLM